MIAFTLIKANEDVDFSIPEVDVEENETIPSSDEEVDNVVGSVALKDTLKAARQVLKGMETFQKNNILGILDPEDIGQEKMNSRVAECAELEVLDEACEKIIKEVVSLYIQLIDAAIIGAKIILMFSDEKDISGYKTDVSNNIDNIFLLKNNPTTEVCVQEVLDEKGFDIQKFLDIENSGIFA